MAYRFAKRLIETGNYVKEDMLSKLDILLLGGRITQEQYNELVALMG